MPSSVFIGQEKKNGATDGCELLCGFFGRTISAFNCRAISLALNKLKKAKQDRTQPNKIMPKRLKKKKRNLNFNNTGGAISSGGSGRVWFGWLFCGWLLASLMNFCLFCFSQVRVSLCSPSCPATWSVDWSQTQRPVWLCLLSAGIKVTCHHSLVFIFLRDGEMLEVWFLLIGLWQGRDWVPCTSHRFKQGILLEGMRCSMWQNKQAESLCAQWAACFTTRNTGDTWYHPHTALIGSLLKLARDHSGSHLVQSFF